MVQVTQTVQFHEKTLAMNEALMAGSVRQHHLATTAESLNEQLRARIAERTQAETALRISEAALRSSQEQINRHAENLEKEVTQRTLELTASNKQLETFVYSIAHDLRAPLRALQGYAVLLVEEAGAALTVSSKDYAERINKSAQFMDALLKGLLVFSRISQQPIELTAVDLKAIVASVLARLDRVIQETHAQVEVSGPWPVVLAHEATLVQILFNLVSNALKFVTAGVPPVVRLRTDTETTRVRVWVEDNGPGIDPRHQDQIFRLFARLDREKSRGTGLGLAIVQQGVARMGGEVGVESSPGQGSRFWFSVKAAKTIDSLPCS
jgi:signal transduction histidine kinase